MTSEISKLTGLNLIVWSKDRPMQLDVCLQSIAKHFKEAKTSTISVVYRSTTEKGTKAYDKLISKWKAIGDSGGPRFNFIYDTSFFLMTLVSFGYHEQTMFVVDDQIFIRDFSIFDEPFELQRKNPNQYFTISLRLDKTKNYCYPVNEKQDIPSLNKLNNCYSWPWKAATHDWGYVASLDGNVYLTNPIRGLLARLSPTQINNPNTLEMALNQISKQPNANYPAMCLCYEQAKTVTIPVNKVQTTFNNRSEDSYNVSDLENMWLDGYEIDFEELKNQIIDSNSPHTPATFSFIKKE